MNLLKQGLSRLMLAHFIVYDKKLPYSPPKPVPFQHYDHGVKSGVDVRVFESIHSIGI
jgi:hypothetical protein